MQSRTSAQDQIDLLTRVVELRNCRVVATFLDEGLSGATLSTRPQALALLEAAKQGRFNLVMCEALDRLSRDQEDTARIYKHLTFAGVRLESLSEGRISELHVGLAGTMNQLYLAELARKTRRGLIGRVRAGFSGGGRCYGYAIAARGVLVVDPPQAAVVRRIFDAFAAGDSAAAICHELEAEAVPAPRGERWRNTTLLGSPRRGDGILCQELYVGSRVFNRRRYRKHPDTGRRSSVLNPEEEWLREPVPELRIIEDALWARVQARRSGVGGVQTRPRRPKRLLSQLLVCARCGATMTLCGGRYSCPARPAPRTCSNRRVVSARRLEIGVIAELLERLDGCVASDGGSDVPAADERGRRLLEINARLSRLQTLFIVGEITIEQVRTQAAPLRRQRASLERQAKRDERHGTPRQAAIRSLVLARDELGRTALSGEMYLRVRRGG